MNIRCFPTCPGVVGPEIAWSAIDDDTYDGAPDSGARARCVGLGASKADAIADLEEQLAERDEAEAEKCGFGLVSPWTEGYAAVDEALTPWHLRNVDLKP